MHSGWRCGRTCWRLSMVSIQSEAERIELAARLHDIGKVVIPDSVIRKRTALSQGERQLIETHAATGADFLIRAKVPYAHWPRKSPATTTRHGRAKAIRTVSRATRFRCRRASWACATRSTRWCTTGHGGRAGASRRRSGTLCVKADASSIPSSSSSSSRSFGALMQSTRTSTPTWRSLPSRRRSGRCAVPGRAPDAAGTRRTSQRAIASAATGTASAGQAKLSRRRLLTAPSVAATCSSVYRASFHRRHPSARSSHAGQVPQPTPQSCRVVRSPR